MQKNKDMDLEYAKPLDEYTLPYEYTEKKKKFRAHTENKKSISKSIKKLMMFASASVLTMNIALGISFTPSKSVTNEKLEQLTPYMANIFPLLQEKDANGIKLYINEIRDELEGNELLKDDEGNIDIYGVYVDSENMCILNKSEITQDQGFAFHIIQYEFGSEIDLFLANVKNGNTDGEVYYFFDMPERYDVFFTFDGVLHGNDSDLVTRSQYDYDSQSMTYNSSFSQSCSFTSGKISGPYTLADMFDSTTHIWKFDLDENGQLILNKNDTILFESDYATEDDFNAARWAVNPTYTVDKYGLTHWAEDGPSITLQIDQAPLGLYDTMNSYFRYFMEDVNNFIQSVYTCYD